MTFSVIYNHRADVAVFLHWCETSGFCRLDDLRHSWQLQNTAGVASHVVNQVSVLLALSGVCLCWWQMSVAPPTADSRPKAEMLSSALQPTFTITTASLAPGPPTPTCTLEPGTHTHNHYTRVLICENKITDNLTHVFVPVYTKHEVPCVLHAQKNAPSLTHKKNTTSSSHCPYCPALTWYDHYAPK